jgi:spore maturation protein CgeB
MLALIDGRYPVLSDLLSDWPDVMKIGWMMDDPFWSLSGQVRDLHIFDRLYTVEGSLVAPLRLATGRDVRCVPLGADPTVFRPLPLTGGQSGVVFVGKSYSDTSEGTARSLVLSQVASQDLAIWGDDGWRTSSANGVELSSFFRGGPVPPATTNAIYNAAAIVLNIHHSQIRMGTSLRSFAICASGAFQLVDWRPGLSDFLEPDVEVVTYRSGQELAELVARFLVESVARTRIAAAGRLRVLAQHTYLHRLSSILKESTGHLP